MSYILLFGVLSTFFFMLSLFIGELIHSQFKINKIKEGGHFLSFVGIVLIVSVFSVFYTRVKTINIFSVLFLIVYFIRNYDKNNERFKVSIKEILINGGKFLLLFITVSVFHIFFFKENLDILFYGGMISNGIYETGIENYYGYYNEYLPEHIANKTTPYHYFEMWLTVLFKQLPIDYSFLMVLKYLVYSFIETYIVFSIYSLLKSLSVKINMFFYIPIILITAIPLGSFLGLFNESWHAFYFSFWNYPNFILYSFVLINSLTFFLKNDFVNGVLILLLLPIVSITTAPTILTTVFIVGGSFYYAKIFEKKEALLICVSSIVLAVSILLFYKFTGSKVDLHIQDDTYWLERYKNAWKAILYILGVVNGIIFTFLIVLSLFNEKAEAIEKSIFYKILFICMLSVSSGVFLYQLVFYVENSYQFVYVGYNLIFLVFILLFLKGLFSKSKLRYLSYVVVFASLFYNAYNNIGSFSFKDRRFAELSNYEDSLIEKKQEFEKILNNERKVIVVLTEETLPYIRSFTYRVPMSGLFFLGDYKIITMVDDDILYNPVEGRKYDVNYDRARKVNSVFPQNWFNLKNIDAVAKHEQALFIAIPNDESVVRSNITSPVKDSLCLSRYKLLFLE